MHQLLAHDPAINPLYFITKFCEGLRDDIRTSVLVQRPIELETALAIALLQEEAAEAGRRRDPRRHDGAAMGRHTTRPAYPLQPPPRGGSDSRAEDCRAAGNGHTRPPTTDDKVGALKAYRRAQGLCYICADRWAPGHKFAPTVQLHAVEEMFAMLSLHNSREEDSGSQAASDDHTLCVLLSHEAYQGAESAGTIRLLGHMQGYDLQIGRAHV